MAKTQTSLCTLTFIVWGRRERLGKRDKDCPGVTATLGWSHTWQHMQGVCPCSGMWGLVVWDGSRGSGWTQKESRCKGSRRDKTGRTEGEEAALGSCSRETRQGLFPVPKLVGNHSLGASLTWDPASPLIQGALGGQESLCPRAGGDVLCHPLLQG